MDEESKKHAQASLDFWAKGKAIVSPKFDPRHLHDKQAATALMEEDTDKEKIEEAKKREMEFLEK
jgi:hypothetical protein